MPSINVGQRLQRQYAFSRRSLHTERTALAGTLITLLVAVFYGCTAHVTSPSQDGHRSLVEETGPGLNSPSIGPASAAVTLTVFEEYQ